MKTPIRNRKPDVGASGTSGKPSKGAARRPGKRARTAIQAAVVCVAMATLFLLALALQSRVAIRMAQPTKEAKSVVATVRLAPEGNSCREFHIDNQTGRMTDDVRVTCTSSGTASSKAGDVMRDRYSGGRLDSIRDSFSSR